MHEIYSYFLTVVKKFFKKSLMEKNGANVATALRSIRVPNVNCDRISIYSSDIVIHSQ